MGEIVRDVFTGASTARRSTQAHLVARRELWDNVAASTTNPTRRSYAKARVAALDRLLAKWSRPRGGGVA